MYTLDSPFKVELLDKDTKNSAQWQFELKKVIEKDFLEIREEQNILAISIFFNVHAN